LVATLELFGMAGAGEPPPVDAGSPIEALLEFVGPAEEGFEALFAALISEVPAVEGVARSVEVIKGVDGNDITLFVHRPAGADDPLPGVLHLHGGGMVLLEAAGPIYAHWRDELAASGLVVVGVEFRNAGGKHGNHPFPAGLNDCSSALAWTIEQRGALGISKLVVSGESGGGNLTLATVLRAKRDGRIGDIDGVYALCPYISGAYAPPRPELASLVENDQYFLDCRLLGALAKVYDPDGAHRTNPLAWPYHASADDLSGLPPHVISVNQLDPLRDEGIAYARKLVDAGVSTICRTVNGTTHAGDVMFRASMPDVYAATVRDLHGFCASL
jgi:acetyl esterase/lipase